MVRLLSGRPVRKCVIVPGRPPVGNRRVQSRAVHGSTRILAARFIRYTRFCRITGFSRQIQSIRMAKSVGRLILVAPIVIPDLTTVARGSMIFSDREIDS
jgi:hypothetical protein